jgi:parvulin-like peptidyl-prolyl isomerase
MMSLITITKNDLLQHIKCSYRVPEMVAEMVKIKIIVNKAEELQIKIDNEDLQKAADIVRVANGMQTAQDTWSWLKKHDLSLDDFEENIFVTLISSQLANHLFEEKIEKHFVENTLNYYGAVIREIVFENEDLAMEYFFSIKEDEISFFEVAYKYIKDIDLKRKCGYRGLLNKKQLKPEISASIFSASPPCLLNPIKTNLGFHLIFVEEIIKPTLDDKLRAFIVSELFTDWLEKELGKIDMSQPIV